MWTLNDDLKLRLNLSELALSVIEQDQLTFGANSRSGFLNRVFINFYKHSEASITCQLEKNRQAYMQMLETDALTENARMAAVEQLLQRDLKNLQEKYTAMEKGHKTWVHTLPVDLKELLMETSVKEESRYYTLSKYFKAVIEDYCRQSQLCREEIYFADFFKEIRSAIALNTQLQLRSFSGARYFVHPYKILTDPLQTTHYLVGYARTDREHISQKMPYSFRISNLKKVAYTEDHAFLSKQSCKELDELVDHRGVQFLVGQVKPIQVQLTAQGVQKMHRYSTLRPPYTEDKESGIYTFHCTEAQAEFYFLRLGADAQILSPQRLRDKFYKMHAQAVKNYEKNEK